MIKNIITALILLACSASSCTNHDEDKGRFANAYLEILLARETYDDSAAASKEIVKIYDRYGFTVESFKDKYFSYAETPEEFIRIVDSIRSLAKREIEEIKLIEENKTDGNKETGGDREPK